MNNLFLENKKSFLLLLGLFFIMIVVAYFLFYQPLTKELQVQANQKMQLESDITLYNSQLNSAGTEDSNNMDIEKMKFAKFMPSTKELENFLLTIEEIELVSGSRIDDLTLSYDGTLPERVEKEEAVLESESNEIETGETDNNMVSDDELESESEIAEEIPSIIELAEKPENLRLITVSITVTSPDYKHFQQFIQEIEKQERIMMVNRVEFEKPAESELMIGEEADESIVSTIDVTTFYFDETGTDIEPE